MDRKQKFIMLLQTRLLKAPDISPGVASSILASAMNLSEESIPMEVNKASVEFIRWYRWNESVNWIEKAKWRSC